MSILVEGPASPRQLAAEIGEPLNNVTYHVNQLRDLGCIELDRTEPRAGGRVIERFYRARQRAYFDDDAWAVLGDRERLGVIWSIVRLISKDLATAMVVGHLLRGLRHPHHPLTDDRRQRGMGRNHRPAEPDDERAL